MRSTRAIERLRRVSIELGMAPIRPAVHILPEVLVPAMTAEAYDPALFSTLDAQLDTFVGELLWWKTALRTARTTVAA